MSLTDICIAKNYRYVGQIYPEDPEYNTCESASCTMPRAAHKTLYFYNRLPNKIGQMNASLCATCHARVQEKMTK